MADEHGPRGDDPGDPLDPAFADGSRTDDRGQAGPRRPAAPSRAIGRLAANAEPVVERVTSAARSALDAAVERWEERPGARVRRLRRLARRPLPSLYERHPEARRAFPREVGVRPIPVDRIVGSAVGGATQRGADFLPLKPFRSANWAARWQRVRSAVDGLEVLPPIDVVRFGDGYWVLDGHNRVAAALYAGQVEIDAAVTELVLPGSTPTERRTSLADGVLGAREARLGDRGRATIATRAETRPDATSDGRTVDAEPASTEDDQPRTGPSDDVPRTDDPPDDVPPPDAADHPS